MCFGTFQLLFIIYLVPPLNPSSRPQLKPSLNAISRTMPSSARPGEVPSDVRNVERSLQAFYAIVNPAKVGAVPKIVERFVQSRNLEGLLAEVWQRYQQQCGVHSREWEQLCAACTPAPAPPQHRAVTVTTTAATPTPEVVVPPPPRCTDCLSLKEDVRRMEADATHLTLRFEEKLRQSREELEVTKETAKRMCSEAEERERSIKRDLQSCKTAKAKAVQNAKEQERIVEKLRRELQSVQEQTTAGVKENNRLRRNLANLHNETAQHRTEAATLREAQAQIERCKNLPIPPPTLSAVLKNTEEEEKREDTHKVSLMIQEHSICSPMMVQKVHHNVVQNVQEEEEGEEVRHDAPSSDPNAALLIRSMAEQIAAETASHKMQEEILQLGYEVESLRAKNAMLAEKVTNMATHGETLMRDNMALQESARTAQPPPPPLPPATERDRDRDRDRDTTLGEIRAVVDELQLQKETLTSRLEQAMQDNSVKSDALKSYETLQDKHTRLQEKLRDRFQQFKQTEEEIQAMNAKYDKLVAEQHSTEQGRLGLEAHLNSVTAENAALSRKVNDSEVLLAYYEKNESRLQTAEDTINMLRGEAARSESQCNTLEGKVAELRDTIATQERTERLLHLKLDSLTAEAEALHRETEILQKKSASTVPPSSTHLDSLPLVCTPLEAPSTPFFSQNKHHQHQHQISELEHYLQHCVQGGGGGGGDSIPNHAGKSTPLSGCSDHEAEVACTPLSRTVSVVSDAWVELDGGVPPTLDILPCLRKSEVSSISVATERIVPDVATVVSFYDLFDDYVTASCVLLFESLVTCVMPLTPKHSQAVVSPQHTPPLPPLNGVDETASVALALVVQNVEQRLKFSCKNPSFMSPEEQVAETMKALEIALGITNTYAATPNSRPITVHGQNSPTQTPTSAFAVLMRNLGSLCEELGVSMHQTAYLTHSEQASEAVRVIEAMLSLKPCRSMSPRQQTPPPSRVEAAEALDGILRYVDGVVLRVGLEVPYVGDMTLSQQASEAVRMLEVVAQKRVEGLQAEVVEAGGRCERLDAEYQEMAARRDHAAARAEHAEAEVFASLDFQRNAAVTLCEASQDIHNISAMSAASTARFLSLLYPALR